ncbi:endoglucanase 18-like [Mercurialis annua]|uniref:endoglucanase 18-like n=1 Tax=Mercurialis annua TaxID=3986 RepID=UPI00215EB864|nr:endoglucanase 18-like [Mercurialis annua]
MEKIKTVVMYWVLVFCCVLASEGEGEGGLAIGNIELNSLASTGYGDALAKAIIFYDGQRSGKLPANQQAKWRGDSGLLDGRPENVNLVGGYYDAGDNVKFTWPMSYTITLLSLAATEYTKGISSVNQLPNLQRAIRWGSDYLIKCHTSSTTFYTQVGDGNGDHQCWERPEDMDTPRTLYKITQNSPGTEAAAEAAAALAAASIVFKTVDSTYSANLLSHAKSLFEFADNYRGSFKDSCPFYCSYSGFQDELLWGATLLYKATRDNKYLNYVSNNQGWSQAVNEFSWDNKFAGVQTLLAKEFYAGKTNLAKFKTDAESFVCALVPGSSSVQIRTTPGGLLYTRDSSNLQYVTSASMLLLIHSKTLSTYRINGVQCGSAHFSPSQIRAFAKSQVDYILGNNPMKMSYMVGYGSKYPTQLHHRGASIPSIKVQPAKVGCNDGYSNYYNVNKPNPNTHVGAVVGGPDSNDQYRDLRSEYSRAEPTTYMNAAFIGSVAALLTPSENINGFPPENEGSSLVYQI